MSKGAVKAAAVEATTGQSATVAVTATSQVSNSNGAGEAPRTWRMSVTVDPDGHDLKISKIEIVP